MRTMLFTAPLLACTSALAAIHTESIEYSEGDTTLEGYLAYDDRFEEPRPGVLIVHEWWGLTDHPKKSAEKLAELGYVAFALDMYGKGKVTDDPQQAGQWAGQFKSDPQLAKRRFNAALELLRGHDRVDSGHIGAMGYCFGGSIVLDMARLGLDLDGVVSFHGGLASQVPEADKDFKASVLVCHGAVDPLVSQEELNNFKGEMGRHDVDWMLINYGGAKHSFTNPKADTYGMDATAYNPVAARRSWEHMKLFFEERLH